jgi:hypothetical protein
MAQVKLAEALLRRKELGEKVKLTATIKAADLFTLKVKRQNVTENVDEVTANVPKLTLSQVTAEFDHYAKALRHIDAAIQQANWTTTLDLPDFSMKDWSELNPTPAPTK